MITEESGSLTERAGSSDRIEHRPSKPLAKSATVRGEETSVGGLFAHRLPQKPKVRHVDYTGRVVYRYPPGGRDADFLAFIEASAARGTLTAFIAEFLARTREAENGCLEWVRLKHFREPVENGYGTLTFELDGVERGMAPHRASWLLFVGPIAPEHPATRHLCHNKRCVNWFHLEPGTTSENLLDNRHKPNLAPRLRPVPRPAPWMIPLGGWPQIGYRPPDRLDVAKKLEAARIAWLETEDPGALRLRISRLLAQLREG